MLCGNTVRDSGARNAAEVTCSNSAMCQAATELEGAGRAQGHAHEEKTKEQREERAVVIRQKGRVQQTEQSVAVQVRLMRTAGPCSEHAAVRLELCLYSPRLLHFIPNVTTSQVPGSCLE